MKHLICCAIILAGIRITAQVKPYAEPVKPLPHSKVVVDTTHFDSISETHQKLQEILRDEMQLKDPKQ